MTFMVDSVRELTPDDMRRICVGNRFWGVTVDKIPDSAAYKAMLKKYIENLKEHIEDGIGMLFEGKPRAGKTSAAVIIAKAVMAHSGTAFFIRADELTKAVIEKQQFDEDGMVADRMREVDLLVIDDLGEEHSKDF